MNNIYWWLPLRVVLSQKELFITKDIRSHVIAVMRLSVRAYSLLHLHCTCMLHKGSV